MDFTNPFTCPAGDGWAQAHQMRASVDVSESVEQNTGRMRFTELQSPQVLDAFISGESKGRMYAYIRGVHQTLYVATLAGLSGSRAC